MKRNDKDLRVCQSVDKIPEYADPDYQTRIRIARCSKIVISESKTVSCSGCIQIFCPDKSSECPDAKMKIGRNIRAVAYADTVLKIK